MHSCRTIDLIPSNNTNISLLPAKVHSTRTLFHSLSQIPLPSDTGTPKILIALAPPSCTFTPVLGPDPPYHIPSYPPQPPMIIQKSWSNGPMAIHRALSHRNSNIIPTDATHWARLPETPDGRRILFVASRAWSRARGADTWWMLSSSYYYGLIMALDC